jgi:hypothetical protein
MFMFRTPAQQLSSSLIFLFASLFIYTLNPLLIRINWGVGHQNLAIIRISEAKGSAERQKLKTQINGKFNDINR